MDDNSIAIDNTTNTITTTNSSVNGNNIIDIKDTIDYYNKLKANNFDSTNLIPVWYTSAINSVQDTINKVIEHSKIKFKEQYGDHNLTPIHFLRKDNFITDGEFDEAKYNEYFDGVMKSFMDTKKFEFISRESYYSNLEELKVKVRETLTTNVGGRAYPVYFIEKETGNEIKIPLFFVAGPISDIIDTKQTAIHELTHIMQYIYEYNKASEIDYSIRNIEKEWSKACKELEATILDKTKLQQEEEKLDKNGFKNVNTKCIDELINQYIMESQADLCGDLFLVLEALMNSNKEEIEYLKTRLLCDTQADFFTGYDAFNPLLKEIEKIGQNPEKYKNQFMDEKGEIDYLKLFKYTYEVISEESEKYRKFFNERLKILIDKKIYLPHELNRNYASDFKKNIREDSSNLVGKEFSDKKKYKADNSHLCYDMSYKLNDFIHNITTFKMYKEKREKDKNKRLNDIEVYTSCNLTRLIEETNDSKLIKGKNIKDMTDEEQLDLLLNLNKKISKQSVNTEISHS